MQILNKPKGPFHNEIENTQKMLSKKFHYSKDTCKALLALFEDLCKIEEDYSKSLNQLLHAGNFHISLNKSKENDSGAIRGVIDVFLSGMLQISENHAKLKNLVKTKTMTEIKAMLDSLRTTKKQCLNEIEINVKKPYEKLTDKFNSAQADAKKLKNLESNQNLDLKKKELEGCESSGKQKLLEILQQAESVDICRSKQTKDILIDHIRNLIQMTQSDSDLSLRLFQTFQQGNIQLDLEDFQKAKNKIDPNNSFGGAQPQLRNFISQAQSLPLSNQQIERGFVENTQIQQEGPTLHKNNTSPTKLKAFDSYSSQSPHNFNDHGNFFQENDKAQMNQLYLPRSQKKERSPNQKEGEYSINQIDPMFVTKQGLYLKNQIDEYLEFPSRRAMFIETGPHYHDLVTKFDAKFLNGLMYVLLSTHIKLEGYGKSKMEMEDLTLMTFKNKLRLSIRETKLLDTVFNMKLKSKIDYQTHTMEGKTLLDIIIDNLRRFLKKKKAKIRDILSKKEDNDYVLNVLKHFVVILAENHLWEQDSRKKLGLEILTEEEQNTLLKDYDQIFAFFFKDKPLDYKTYDIEDLIVPILENKILTKTQMKLSYPINLQVSEAVLSCIMETAEDGQLFIDGWEENLKVFLPFIKKCLGLQPNLIYLLLLENVFNQSIKPNLVLKKHYVKDQIIELQLVIKYLLDKVRSAELESPSHFDGSNSRDFEERELIIKINKYVSFNASKDIWINCLRLFENLRKLIPPDIKIVQGLSDITYCSFFYQKDNLKTKDYLESMAKALETSGSHIAMSFEMSQRKKKKDTHRSMNVPQKGLEYTQLLENLEIEIKEALDSHLAVLMIALQRTLEKPKESFEKRLKEAFCRGCMSNVMVQLEHTLALDQDNTELEEDIIVIANQLGRIDGLLHNVGVTKSNFTDVCSVALEKWFINYTKKSKDFANQILKKESWKAPDGQDSCHTNVPVDLCYILFNPIQIFKQMSEGYFKEKAIKKFEMTVFEVLSQYFEHLEHSLDPLLQQNTPSTFKKISLPLNKKKPANVNQKELDDLESNEQLLMLQQGIEKLCIRLGNMSFIQKEIENSLTSLFGPDSILMTNLVDFVATYLKRLSKKIAKLLVMNQFRAYFFKYLYLNFNDAALASKSTENFRDDYEFSGTCLLGYLNPIMKILKVKVPPQYLPRLLLEIMDPFLQEYIMCAIDPDKAPRDNYKTYKDFLMTELDKFIEFFFPPNSEIIAKEMIKFVYIKDKFAMAYKIVSYFQVDTQQLIQEFKTANPLAESDYMKYKVIPRILLLRPSDGYATQFLKNYKEVLQ